MVLYYSTTSAETILGLGLFISRQLTELQGGEIGVASEAGVGSTFAFYVKSRRTGAQEDPEIARKRASWEAKSNSRQVTDNFEAQSTFGSVGTETTEQEVIPAPIMLVGPSEWHVLIVEDNVVNQRILAQQIRKLGSTVYVANHGGEALEIIQQSKHHVGHELDGKELSVILMDLEVCHSRHTKDLRLMECTDADNGWSHMCAKDSRDGGRRSHPWSPTDYCGHCQC